MTVLALRGQVQVWARPLADAAAWVMDGRITDAISAAGILRLWSDRERLID